MKFLLPLAVATGAAMATDTRAMTQVVPINANLNQHSTDASNMLIGGFIATPVALYGLGHFKRDPHATEDGILTGEAMLDSVVVEQGKWLARLKKEVQRQSNAMQTLELERMKGNNQKPPHYQ